MRQLRALCVSPTNPSRNTFILLVLSAAAFYHRDEEPAGFIPWETWMFVSIYLIIIKMLLSPSRCWTNQTFTPPAANMLKLMSFIVIKSHFMTNSKKKKPERWRFTANAQRNQASTNWLSITPGAIYIIPTVLPRQPSSTTCTVRIPHVSCLTLTNTNLSNPSVSNNNNNFN